MQRRKEAVSLEVKQVIVILRRLLAAASLGDVPAPEAFRKAKFGFGIEMESQFWQLIANILHSSGIVHSRVGAQPKGEYKKLVAAGLWQTGYYADWMYRKEEGGNVSSKDLLLAVGWLLSTGIIEKLLMQRVQKLDKTLLSSVPVNTQVSHELQLDFSLLRRLQWLVGSMRHEGRILLPLLQEKTRLRHAVFSASLSSTVPCFSYQNSTALKDDYICKQQLCDLLEAYVSWKQVENVFWTWMDSVVECQLSQPEKCTHIPNMSAIKCHQGNQGLKKLGNMLMKLPTTQNTEEGHRRGRGDVEERGKENLKDGLDTSLCLLISLPRLSSFSHYYTARLQAERPVRHSRYPSVELHNWAKSTEDLQSSSAAQVLLQTEAQLLQRRDQQRLANRMMLQHIIGHRDELGLMLP